MEPLGKGASKLWANICVTSYAPNSIPTVMLPIIPVPRRLRQEDREFKVALGYIESLGMTWVALPVPVSSKEASKHAKHAITCN